MKLTIIILILLLITPVSAGFNPVRENKDAWTCYDYSMNFSEQNPDWGLVCISTNPYFKGYTHLVNYKYINNNTILIHDGLNDCDYPYINWQYDGYFHFFIDETPMRHYKRLRDNREVLDGIID